MLFNSFQFLLFFLTVYLVYLRVNHRLQNVLLLIASYAFYASWNWKFLSLIIISTLVDYICGIRIDESNNRQIRKKYLILSIFTNLFILFIFKYFGFFSRNLCELIHLFGFDVNVNSIKILLPVGISFYTFQTMSYTIDIYREKMKPTRNLLDFSLFVAFFPQLVAGPIERASHLLPQIMNPRKVTSEKFQTGVYLIFWGLFLKCFVADGLAFVVDPVFNSSAPYNGVQTLLAMYSFAFQIFGDFAGYSSIARGLGKCMGFDIMINFNLPYYATNPSDFWKRWHISLSGWLKDYLYIPLGGNRISKYFTYRNLLLTMILGGLWHGAAWTFVVWGIYHGLLLAIYRFLKPRLSKLRVYRDNSGTRLWYYIRVLFFFHIICIGWLVFRAENMSQAAQMFQSLLFNMEIREIPVLFLYLKRLLFFSGLLIIVQHYQFIKKDQLIILKINPAVRAMFYYTVFYLLVLFGTRGADEFIYFQF